MKIGVTTNQNKNYVCFDETDLSRAFLDIVWPQKPTPKKTMRRQRLIERKNDIQMNAKTMTKTIPDLTAWPVKNIYTPKSESN